MSRGRRRGEEEKEDEVKEEEGEGGGRGQGGGGGGGGGRARGVDISGCDSDGSDEGEWVSRLTCVCSACRVTGGELFEDIVAREYYSEADAR